MKRFNISKLGTFQNLIIFASLIPVIIFGSLIYYNSKEERTEATFKHIQSLNEENKEVVIQHFDKVKFHTNELKKTISFLQKQATKNIINIQELQKGHIQDYYLQIENDVLSLAQKDVFKYIYNFLERKKEVNTVYFENIYAYKEGLNIGNVLMMDTDGMIVYSSDDKSLLYTNADELTKAFQTTCSILKNKPKELKATFVNMGYNKVGKKYVQYAVAPFSGVDGYIAIEISQKPIEKIIYNVASLGNSAETYLIYKDKSKTYLASNRIKKVGKIGDEKYGSYIDKGFTQSGTDIKYGSLGDIELVGFTPLKVKNITLSMQTTVAYTEIISPIIDGHDYFEQFIRGYDYKNVLLIGSGGDIFYSVLKEDDYKTNIFTGPYKDTILGKAVQQVFTTKKFVLTDIGSYAANKQNIAQFALLPILRKDGSIQTVVVLEVNINALSEKLTHKKYIHQSFETYLVGEDSRLRTDTKLGGQNFTLEKSFQKNIFITTDSVKHALSATKGIEDLVNYREIPVLSAYDFIEYPNFTWAIVSEVDEKEIELKLQSLKYNIILFVLIASLIAFVVMYIITDEKKKRDKEVNYRATHDSLTGLPNRKFALEFLAYVLANNKRTKKKGAVLFIDLDKFKIINDSYGHGAGDIVLKKIAKRLRKVLRAEDLIARLGGDEFILIVNNYESLRDIDVLCQKVLDEVALPIFDEQRVYQIGLSIGIATFPDDSNVAEELLQFSDTAMFKTKDDGRNGYTYYSKEMTDKSLEISRVESELKIAIAQNQLVLHYQPQVDTIHEKVIGVEALVRWNHPRDGFVMPGDFISIAEESMLIVELGYWVTYEACKTFQQWKDDGSDLEYIAINMSTRQLQSPDAVEKIQAVLDALDFNPQWLELEITETTLISNLENTIENINVLKKMGIKFSIDDFGTGYSSFSYLKSLRISTLKIDREFITDMVDNKDDRAIVKAIILMGHTLQYTIVAEGVETKEELELLKSFFCNTIQGYYFSKPLAEKELLAYVKEQNNA